MASFNKEKNIPIPEFLADESKRATGLYGPVSILSDLVELAKMFDPQSHHNDSDNSPGGLSKENFQYSCILLSHLSQEVINHFATAENLSNHTTDTENPHSVNKAIIGLGNVDNTSDVDKPVSTATVNLINELQNTLTSLLTAHTENTDNPHSITKEQIGLSNDFSDSYKSKVEANEIARHLHTNKSVLDNITSDDVSSWNDKQDSLIFDIVPILNSNNPVKSGGVYSSLLKYIPQWQSNTEYKEDDIVYVNTISKLFGANKTTHCFYKCTFAHTSSNTFASIYWESAIPNSSIQAYCDNYGNVISSTYATKTELVAKQDTLTFDNTPTANSNNPVKSSGVYSSLLKYIPQWQPNTTYKVGNIVFRYNKDTEPIMPKGICFYKCLVEHQDTSIADLQSDSNWEVYNTVWYAYTADRAESDSYGSVISSTYATKTELATKVNVNETLFTEITVTESMVTNAGADGLLEIISGDDTKTFPNNVSELRIYVHLPKDVTLNTSNKPIKINLSNNSETFNDNGILIKAQGTTTSALWTYNYDTHYHFVYHIKNNEILYGTLHRSNYSSYVYPTSTLSMVNTPCNLTDKKYIKVSSTNGDFKFPVGTKVEVYYK